MKISLKGCFQKTNGPRRAEAFRIKLNRLLRSFLDRADRVNLKITCACSQVSLRSYKLEAINSSFELGVCVGGRDLDRTEAVVIVCLSIRTTFPF